MQHLEDHREHYEPFVPQWETVIAAGRVAGTYATQLEMTAAAEMLMIHVQLHTPSSITARE
jgi:hypothetical protein